MSQDIAELLEKYAEFRELVRITDSLPDPDPAVSMLRQGFAECYDALKLLSPPLSERNLYAIYAVLADYRQARDQDDTQAIADIAAGLDAWLRSLLQIVKSHKVTCKPLS